MTLHILYDAFLHILHEVSLYLKGTALPFPASIYLSGGISKWLQPLPALAPILPDPPSSSSLSWHNAVPALFLVVPPVHDHGTGLYTKSVAFKCEE